LHATPNNMHFQTRLLPDSLELENLFHYKPEQYPYALISTGGHDTNGRFDILFAYPQQTLILKHNQGLVAHKDFCSDTKSGFFTALHEWWQSLQVKQNSSNNDLPFTGGWFVYLGYELASEIEAGLNLPLPDSGLPIAFATRCPAAVVRDRHKNKFYALAENEYAHLLDEIESDYRFTQSRKKTHEIKTVSIVNMEEADATPYLKQVSQIKQYINDGDIFQANLSRPWHLTIGNDICDIDIFRQLAQSNPGSFAALVQINGSTIISSSPERLVCIRNGIVETRPIAGTRPRSENREIDTGLAQELLRHPKEKAEHIMLIDLERNDLGRVCEPGSINVNEFMSLESYQHVHHIVSNITGKLRNNISPTNVIQAVFPGGTITGCPKVRCMEILAEMECEARGAYTGSVGYVNRDGDMDLNILIRTMVRSNNKIVFRAGGGIVHDSDPDAELNETRAKAKGLLSAFHGRTEICDI